MRATDSNLKYSEPYQAPAHRTVACFIPFNQITDKNRPLAFNLTNYHPTSDTERVSGYEDVGPHWMPRCRVSDVSPDMIPSHRDSAVSSLRQYCQLAQSIGDLRCRQPNVGFREILLVTTLLNRACLNLLHAIQLNGDLFEPSLDFLQSDVVAIKRFVVRLVRDFIALFQESCRQLMADLSVDCFGERSSPQLGEEVFVGDVCGNLAVVEEVEVDMTGQVILFNADLGRFQSQHGF